MSKLEFEANDESMHSDFLFFLASLAPLFGVLVKAGLPSSSSEAEPDSEPSSDASEGSSDSSSSVGGQSSNID